MRGRESPPQSLAVQKKKVYECVFINAFLELKDDNALSRTRQENSLGELTKKFIRLLQESEQKCIDLNDAVVELGRSVCECGCILTLTFFALA